MAEGIKCPDQFVFGLDIGTRSLVGTIGFMDSYGFHVVAMETLEHTTRAMLDGQVHDINAIGEEITEVKERLEKKINRKLTNVCIAAAGRVLKTITVNAKNQIDPENKITSEDVYTLELSAVDQAHRIISKEDDGINYYCVGYTTVKYYLNGYEIGNLEGHKGSEISVDLLATFLPEEVVDGLYSAVEIAGLEVANMTLEPIAAMNVAIPENFRLLNIALVDVGAGTSDICITKDGSIIAYGMIPYAGDELTEVIAKNYLVDFATAEKIKLGASKKSKITFKDVMGIKNTIDPSDVNKLVDSVVNKITSSVAEKIIELNGGKAVNAVFVVGGGGKIPAFTKQLAKELDIPEARVALRGKEVLENVEFAIDNIKKDPLFVTPIGICINYYNQRNNFISVTVNGNKIKLYDNNKLTVIDAVMQSGFPNEMLFPRRGKGISYTLNGVSRMIRGTAGEPAKVLKNGKETTLTSEIMKNDFIDITESTEGSPIDVKLEELPEFKAVLTFNVNGVSITCPKYPYVNGTIEGGNYIIKDGDVIVMEDYYSVKQLFEFMDVPITGKNIIVNNEDADEDTKVFANFTIKYKDISEISFEELPVPEPAEEIKREVTPAKQTEVTETPLESKEEPKPATSSDAMNITVNGQLVVLSGKSSFTFVDVLDFYPFDMSKMGGTDLIMQVDGMKAEFITPLHEGAEVSLYWQK